jgi:threonine synthase
MLYYSTRDTNIIVESSKAINDGISSEGGLFVPCEIPQLSESLIYQLTDLNYSQRAVEILKLFLTDFSEEELYECVNYAYNKERFETDNIAPIYKLSTGIYFLELWHGPTCAFKDMALQLLPHLMIKSLKKQGEDKEVVILVATSGDTGKAALEGFKDVEGTKIIVFYPENGVSEIQRIQMVTQEGGNVNVVAVEGNFDDTQTGVKEIFTDKKYNKVLEKKNYKLSSANSINWGRLVPQIVYYFSAYIDLLKNEEIKMGEKINIVVPTGNFGNILAAYYAREMGLPIEKLICASNENNVLTDFINTGVYDIKREFKVTSSPSMDILISSNLERLLFLLNDKSSDKVISLMNTLKRDREYTVDDDIINKLKDVFWAGYCDDSETLNTIAQTYKDYSYVVDTHTAVAKNVYDKYSKETGDTTKTIIASTASPFKFSSSVIKAIKGEKFQEGKSEFELLEILAEESVEKVPKALSELDTLPILHKRKSKKEDMKDTVSSILE